MQLSPNIRLRRKYAIANPKSRRTGLRLCHAPGCTRTFKNGSGLTQHQHRAHPGYIADPDSGSEPPSNPPTPSSESILLSLDSGSEDSEAVSNNHVDCDFGGESSGQESSQRRSEVEREMDVGQSDGEGASAQPRSRYRTTVEEIDDEDDIQSASSASAQSRILKHSHPTLNGMSCCCITRCQYLTSVTARICDEHGNWIPTNSPPPLRHDPPLGDWGSFESRTHFELAEFLYKENQMSAGNIDKLLGLWSDHGASTKSSAPFANHQDLYSAIDSIPVGDVPWESFKLKYNGALPETGETPGWMEDTHVVWFRDPSKLIENLLSNTDFDGEFDYMPYQEYDDTGNHRYQHFMSGNWAWRQAVRISSILTTV